MCCRKVMDADFGGFGANLMLIRVIGNDMGKFGCLAMMSSNPTGKKKFQGFRICSFHTTLGR